MCLKRRALGFVFLVLFTGLCSAEAPSGFVEFDFSAADAPVWDIGGDISISQDMVGSSGAPVPLVFGFTLTEDEQGKLSASGPGFVQVGNDFPVGTYSVKGKISGGGSSTKISLNVKVSGNDVIAGVQTPFNISVKYNLEVNAETHTADGTARGSASFGKLSGGKIKTDVSVPLPGDPNGAWALQMTIVPLNKLGGSAVIFIPANNRSLQANLSGSYSSHSDSSKVKVSGFGASRGNNANVTFTTSDGSSSLISLKGKVLGQTVRE